MRHRAFALFLALVACLHGCGKSSPTPTAPTSCSAFSVSPTSLSYSGSGGTGTLSVTAPAGCAWKAASSVPWVTLSGSDSGSGPGTLSYSVAANPLLAARGGALTINAVSVAINQAATPNDPSCQFALSTPARSVGADGASFAIGVTAPPNCRWEASSSVPWLEVAPDDVAQMPKSGSGSLTLRATGNAAADPRVGDATIAGQRLTVTQDGQATRACTYAASASTRQANAVGASGTLTVTTAAGCSWSLGLEPASEAWVTFVAGPRGVGPAAVGYTINENWTFSARSVDIVFRGDSGGTPATARVSQNGASCLYRPSLAALSLPAQEDWVRGQCIRVTTEPAGCQFTARYPSSWMAPYRDSWPPWRDGKELCFLWTANTTGAVRTGEILFEGLAGTNPPGRVAVTQAAR